MQFKNKFTTVLYYILNLFIRLGHWFDLIIEILLCDWVITAKIITGDFSFLVYIIPIIQIILNVKYEFKVFASRGVCLNMLNNYHVQSFSGMQGGGKTSFSSYLSSFKSHVGNIYSNTPMKINNKYTYMVDAEILNLDARVPDYSLLYFDEATLYYNNLAYKDKKNGLKLEIYSQEVLTQLVRHFFDGWVFYISTDTERLPAVIRENMSISNYMLEQKNKTVSYITAPLFVLISMLFGLNLKNGIRCWSFQQFRKIPFENYVYDLGNNEKTSTGGKYSDLLEVCAFNNPYKFIYNDRFMHGLYEQLPKHKDRKWKTLKFSIELLKDLGYGEIIEFFEKKNIKTKTKKNIKTKNNKEKILVEQIDIVDKCLSTNVEQSKQSKKTSEKKN